MDRKAETLRQRIEKTGLRAAVKAGHPLTADELRELKVQVLPVSVRGVFGLLSLGSAVAAGFLQQGDHLWAAIGCGMVAVMFFFFAVIGVRRTVDVALESLNYETAEAVLELAASAIKLAASAASD